MWKIGDRVIVVEAPNTRINVNNGDKGIVIDVRPGTGDVLVQFDKDIGGHDGNGRGSVVGKSGHCWWLYRDPWLSKGQVKSEIDYLDFLICAKIKRKRKNNFY